MPPATISTAVNATDAGATQDRLEPAPSCDPLLAIEGVTVRFGGVVALDGVSFDVARGAICGLIGPNGAGKTTLFNCLSRLYHFDHGTIRFEGQSLTRYPVHRIAALGIGRTFQNLALFRTLTVLENIMIGGHCRSRGGFFANAVGLPLVRREERGLQDRAAELAAFLGLESVGRRVVAPALWARGIRSLSTLLITHGDPDHIGGAPGVLASLAVGEAWFGIHVPRHERGNELLAELAARHVGVRHLRAGTAMDLAGLRLRVLHPPEPDWERQRVRNDDSVVVEMTYGDVAFLLLGDVSDEVERAIVPQLRPARMRVLKVAHHGSRTSTSQELLDAWRPQLALISAGRGNSFGHPARDVLERLDGAGARVLRTDRDGEITIVTDGRELSWRTYRKRGGYVEAGL